LDFLICYESTFAWVGSPVIVRITITNPSAPPGSPPVQKHHGHLAVIAKKSKSDGGREFLSTFTSKDGSFHATLTFEEPGTYFCMAQFEYSDLQERYCKVQVGASALIESMFQSSSQKKENDSKAQ
jgi:hypothetical protein